MKNFLLIPPRVGVDIMLHLLTQTSTFVALPNECLCQVTGKPLIHIRLVTNALSDTSVNPAHKRPADTETQQRPEKRPRLIPADSIQRTDSLQRMDSFRRTNSKSAQQETKIVKCAILKRTPYLCAKLCASSERRRTRSS